MADSLTEPVEGIALRPITSGDREFLAALYGSTREEERKLLDWDASQWAGFISQQFAAQDRQYRASFPDGRFEIIEMGGKPVGRLYSVRLEDQLHIIDVAILPAERGRGIGSSVMRSVLAAADEAGIAVTLHVKTQNPARRLYERLGFRRREIGPVYEFMERPAARP